MNLFQCFHPLTKRWGRAGGSGTLRASLFSHSSVPSSTHYPQPKGWTCTSHWLSPRRKSPCKGTDEKNGVSSSATDTVTSVFMWQDGKTQKQNGGYRANWEKDCQEVECSRFWPEWREESLIRMCWEIIVSLRAVGPFHVYIMHMHGLEQSSETRYPIPHSAPLKVHWAIHFRTWRFALKGKGLKQTCGRHLSFETCNIYKIWTMHLINHFP